MPVPRGLVFGFSFFSRLKSGAKSLADATFRCERRLLAPPPPRECRVSGERADLVGDAMSRRECALHPAGKVRGVIAGEVDAPFGAREVRLQIVELAGKELQVRAA